MREEKRQRPGPGVEVDGQGSGTVKGIGVVPCRDNVGEGKRRVDSVPGIIVFALRLFRAGPGDGIACRSGRTESSEGWMERLEF